ncbi:hypothetical protein BGZ96_012226, partial [Linnemannia gamsii]
MDPIADNPPKVFSHRAHSTETRRKSIDNGITAEETTPTTRKDSVTSQGDNKDQHRNVDKDVYTYASIIAPTDKSDHWRLSSSHRSSSDPGIGRKRAATFAIEIPRFAAKHPRTIRRLRYSHPEPDLVLNEKHQQILEAAFQVHKENLDLLTHEDIEFFAAVTGVTYQATMAWFLRRKEDMKADEASSLPSSITEAPAYPYNKTKNSTAGSGPSTGINGIVETLVEPNATNIELDGKIMDGIVTVVELETPTDEATVKTYASENSPKPSISKTESNNDIIVEPFKSVESSDITVTLAEQTTAVEPGDTASIGAAKDVESNSAVTKAVKIVNPSNSVDNPPATVKEHSATSIQPTAKDGPITIAKKSTVKFKYNYSVHATNSASLDSEPATSSTKSKATTTSTVGPTGTDKRTSVLLRTFSKKAEANFNRPVATQAYGEKSARKTYTSLTSAATPRSTTTKSLSSPPSAPPSIELDTNKNSPSTDQSLSFHVITRKRVPYRHRVIQERQCIERDSFKESGVNLYHEPCKPCMAQQVDGICSFKNFRVFYADSRDDGHDIANYRYGPDFSSDPGLDKSLRFRRSGLDREMAKHNFAHTFPFGHIILERELLHVLGRTGLKLRAIDLVPGAPDHEDYVRCSLSDRQYCEKCNSAIVAGYWMCCVCGEELCLDCFDAFCDTTMCTKGRQHQRKQFVACGKFHAHTLQDYLTALREFEQELPQAAIKAAGKAVLLPITVAVHKELHKRIVSRSPVRYDVSELDWPEEPFQEVLPELFEDLIQALPLPEYTSPKGAFNLAKYFPIGQVVAEISAKLYICKRQLEKHRGFGPMQLSAEMSDSIYICTYTQAEVGGTALWWDIYRAQDRPLVEAFLRKVMAERNSEETDPFT